MFFIQDDKAPDSPADENPRGDPESACPRDLEPQSPARPGALSALRSGHHQSSGQRRNGQTVAECLLGSSSSVSFRKLNQS